MTYIDTKAKRQRIQQALIDAGYDCGPDGADGDLGTDTAKAIIKFRTAHSLTNLPDAPAMVDTDLMRELGLLAIQDPAVVGIAKARGIDLLTLIGLIGPIQRLLKGDTTMTADQIGGVVRTLLAALFAYLAGKGYFPQVSPELLTAITTVIVGAWSLFSNRPKTIVPMSQK